MRIDAVCVKLWPQPLLVSVLLPGICRSWGRGGETLDANSASYTLEGPRQVGPMRQLDRHNRAIVSLAIVSPLT